jgi:hypothetical protein
VFGGPLVQIVLVLLFVFVTMSAIVSSAQELIFQVFGWRTRNLRRTIERMLTDDTYGKEIGRRVYRHPLLNGAGGARKQLTHIEPDTFAIAVATAVQPDYSTGDPIAELPESVEALREGQLKHRLSLIIPQPKEGEDHREAIRTALTAWFDSSIRKSQETYKADAKALAYVIAAAATVTLNVSPIEISQRMMNDEALRTSVGSLMPQITPLLSSPAASGSPTEALASLGDPAVANVLAVLQCSESQSSLPIGWPWMANALDAIGKKNRPAGESALALEQTSCQQAADKVSTAGVRELVQTKSFEREFGPNFKTDPPLMILIGWLITVLAAAQGAPFWFNLIQKLVKR